MPHQGKKPKKTDLPPKDNPSNEGIRRKKLKPLRKEKYKRYILEEEE